MNFEIIEKISPIAPGRKVGQKTLPTEFVLTDVHDVRPHHFNMLRFGRTGQYWHQGSKCLVTYNMILAYRLKSDMGFHGASNEREAYDVEFWQDFDSDGHVEYEYVATYRILFDTPGGWEWLCALDGKGLCQLFADKVYKDER